MKFMPLITLISTFALIGCSFGEYAKKANGKEVTKTKTSTGKTIYKFNTSSFTNKTYFKTSSSKSNGKEKWTIVEYDFNKTTFTANLVKGDGSSKSSGTYKVDKNNNGALVLTFIGNTNWVRPTASADKDGKIPLLWTSKLSDINGTTPNTNLYFFSDYNKALKYVKNKEKKIR